MSFAAAKFRLAVIILGFAGFGRAESVPPNWISPTGTPLTSWGPTDAGGGLATIGLGFAFPLFGDDYTSATLSSNGALYFGGAPGSSEPQATVSGLSQGGYATIAPAWYGTDVIGAGGAGSIYVDTLPGQLVVTFDGVASLPGQSASSSNLATFQVTLDSDGTVIFAYEAFNSLSSAATGVDNSLGGSQQAIVGISDGFGDSNPACLTFPWCFKSSSAMSNGYSYTSASDTIYELINNNPADNSNLAGLDLIFTPVSGAGWNVTSAYNSSGGTGNTDPIVPEPATFAEMALSALVLLAWWRRNPFLIKRCPERTHDITR
jgi:hypothetical protein